MSVILVPSISETTPKLDDLEEETDENATEADSGLDLDVTPLPNSGKNTY